MLEKVIINLNMIGNPLEPVCLKRLRKMLHKCKKMLKELFYEKVCNEL